MDTKNILRSLGKCSLFSRYLNVHNYYHSLALRCLEAIAASAFSESALWLIGPDLISIDVGGTSLCICVGSFQVAMIIAMVLEIVV